ncbi:cation-translocating P-type ATPase [uncultured Megasphaera sp.]|uniref:heavy metal translocating P-type ATPase n=1 Tax=uncultured Megasphaera sp. TaxID=165188 RepID=UPI002658DAF5|nr:cation-translocating P-type ATPase [uncultured Megasphaera sp.]
MYTCSVLQLRSMLPARMRTMLSIKLRQVPGIVSAVTDDKKVTFYYRGHVDLRGIRMFVRSYEEKYGKRKESETEQEWDVAAYRREAIISIGGFIAMNILHKTNPAFYDSILLFRRLFTLYIARRFIKNGVMGVIKDHQANADTLTATAVVASVLAGKPESSLTLLALSNGAEMLTEYAAEKARRQISSLLKLDQRDVWLIENGRERKVPVESLKVGNHIAVHLGEKICVDGRVLGGNAAVNQASITGESNPAIKQEGSSVYAGSVIEAGDLIIEVEKVGADTSLAQIIHLVEEAQTRRAPVQNFADKMANMLVPVSFIGAAIIYGATKDWQRVLNLLFIDFSCGLKLSTATAISAAIGKAARKGILIKGGNYIENLADIDTVVLDKTGTITMGVPQIAHISTVDGVDEKEMILLAASAEMHSVHPLAVAVQKYVQSQNWEVPQHETSETVVARGMKAFVPPFENYSGGEVVVGSRRFMTEEHVQNLPETADKTWGKNLLYVACNKEYMGCLTIEDPVRPAMKKTLNQMRRIGIDEVVMLTGDSKAVASEVARDMDIDSYYAEILPEEKANYVMKLQKRGNVMMVGDGINDAPALAFADIGVSLGGNKTDIAAESAAITIRSDDPSRLCDALNIGRQTMKIVNQNFTATIIINSAAMLLGALGRISPLWAAVIHNTATLAVVLNSVRILGSPKAALRR